MTAPIADFSVFPIKSHLPNSVYWRAVIPIGASGATGTITDAPYGFACAKNTTGVYDVTGMPPCPAVTAENGKATFWFSILSTGGTVGSVFISTAHNLANGTLSFTTAVGVTATEPASGNVITLHCVMERE